MKGYKGRRSLDIGCGGGQFAIEASRAGIESVGMDISFRSLEIAKRHAEGMGAEVEYVYAEPMNPPFKSETFDLLMSKDTLHHLMDPESALKSLKELLRENGGLIIYEHVGKSGAVSRIIEAFNGLLVGKIQRRYENVDVPEVLQRGSVNEDAGMQKVVPAVKKHFKLRILHGEHMLYFEMEQLFYYAFGKRRWVASIARHFFYMVEWLMLKFSSPNHVTIVAHK
jgi:ubiquinone/menaquinone biosynthesis C-methylase UbiE